METGNLNRVEWSGAWNVQGLLARNPLERAVLRAIALLRLWVRRSRQRRELRGILDRGTHFYQDIGVPRATVYNEATKWFWQP